MCLCPRRSGCTKRMGRLGGPAEYEVQMVPGPVDR